MKSERGITLISVTIYIIVMAIVVGIIAVISGFFYNSIEDADTAKQPAQEYTEFNRFFSDEVNRSGAKILVCEETYIIFDNNAEYSFVAENKGVYKNGVKICNNVDSCTFSKDSQNGKTTITVNMVIGGREMNTTYVLQS